MNFLQNKLFTDKIQVFKEIFKVENTTFIGHRRLHIHYSV